MRWLTDPSRTEPTHARQTGQVSGRGNGSYRWKTATPYRLAWPPSCPRGDDEVSIPAAQRFLAKLRTTASVDLTAARRRRAPASGGAVNVALHRQEYEKNRLASVSPSTNRRKPWGISSRNGLQLLGLNRNTLRKKIRSTASVARLCLRVRPPARSARAVLLFGSSDP